MNAVVDEPDLERRFGGLRRLWGNEGYERVRAARIAVIGVGGVGSWAAEALARCGVAELTLIDLDHVAESNINRQVQAVGRTVGAAKVTALAERLRDIHPGCGFHCVEEFVEPDNWPALLPRKIDGLIDACDQGVAKLALARWARETGTPLVCSGAAGGKSQAHRIDVADLADVTHDPLLASMRQRLRKAGAPRTGKLGITCVFSREEVNLPVAVESEVCAPSLSGLNCHGYGSNVMVTASFGMAAAAELLRRLR